ncbi:torsin-1A-interacting protein 2-like [Macrobrachium nipponense]|uniref:torsin-1A-interacting protein 2-like n=1 Tax=Macrobrachium nipponense TaxID=159736 RepID=UPI0030C8B9CD
MESAATARPAIKNRGTNSPPSIPGSPPLTRARASEGRSPVRRDKQEARRLDDEESDEEFDISHPKDEIDRAAHHSSSGVYPDISSLSSKESDTECLPGSSPSFQRHNRSHEEYHVTNRTKCIGKNCPVGTRKGPLTPEKGSPGRKVYPDLRPQDRKKGRVMPLLYIGFIALIIVCVLTFYDSLKNLEEIPSSEPYVKPIEKVYSDIKEELKTINSEFTQTRQFWVQLIGQLETIMRESPVQPAVVLSVVPEGAERTAVCLLHRISQAISDGFEDRRFIMYDVKSEVHKGHLHLKTDLYENLLRLESAHAAIVHNVEKIPGEAAMTFHAFCDNENAPFKQAVIILVIHIPGKYENLSWERLENTIDDYLMGIWGEQLQEKDVSAIVSRVANAPVLIKPESAERLNYACESL